MNQSGAIAGSKEFSSREQAAENQYARQKVKRREEETPARSDYEQRQTDS